MNNHFIYSLLSTDHDYLTTFMRIVLGLVIFPHGAQKLLGWFGGEGIRGTIAHMDQVGVPRIVSWLTIIGQSFGSLSLIIGFLTRIASGGIFIIMLGAMCINLPNGLLMNWTGKKKGEGVEYFILLLAINIFVLFKGAGALALDRILIIWFDVN